MDIRTSRKGGPLCELPTSNPSAAIALETGITRALRRRLRGLGWAAASLAI